jgi:hypothetical protein
VGHDSPQDSVDDSDFGDGVTRFFAGIRDVAIRISEAIAAGAERFAESTRDADAIARRYHWCVSTSWPISFVVEIAEMGSKNASRTTVDRRILAFYSDNNWFELEELTTDVVGRASTSIARRRHIRDLSKIMRAGDRDGFNAANFVVPTLFAQLEGILRDFSRDDFGLTDVARKQLSVRAMIEPLRASAFPIEQPGIDLITRRLWKSTKGRPALVGERNTRHFRLHGHAQAPVRKTDVIRLILMIDLVTALIDRYRSAAAEDPDIAIQFRASYAQLLSYRAAT